MAAIPVTPELYKDLDGKLPIVMLPVRIETRYFASGADLELRVRIFPSMAHVTTDRPSPNQVEHDETLKYWTVRSAQGDTEPATDTAWQRMTSLFGFVRAQWLRRLLKPGKNSDGSLTFPSVTVTAAGGDGSFLESTATGLPTRIVVSGFAGAERLFALAGEEIPASVAVGPHGDATAIAWQKSFTAAELIGLGVRVPLTRADATRLTRIYAYGVREGGAAASSRASLEDLLARHIRGDGATLMRAGTPTNNVSDAPIAAPPMAPEQAPLAGSDGFRVAQALGVDNDLFAGIGGSDAISDFQATAMHLALWPATIEYFMKQTMAPMFDGVTASRIKGLFESYVRPSGPYPALRLGSQPYGLLPVTSAADWRTASGSVDGFMQGLRNLSTNWLSASAHAPHLGASDDVGSDMIAVLSQSPVSRRWLGRRTESQLIAGRNFIGGDPVKYQAAITGVQKQKQDRELAPLGLSGQALALDFIFGATPFHIRAPLVAAGDADRGVPLAANYIAAIATATVDELTNETITGASPPSLLYLFLRHSTLLLLANTASNILTKPPLRDAVFVESTTDTVWTRIKTPVASLGNQSLEQLLNAATSNAALIDVKLQRQALASLATQPVAELERLTAGAIDAASHRLDAWMTAMATERLHAMRNVSPSGAHLGAYGWVDAPPPPAIAPVEGAAPFPDALSEGYVHGTRLEHARTGAILRAAYLSRAHAGAEAPYTIDLSSERVRTARQILAELQGGANLAELLSARIERLMIENNLGPQLPALRTQFSLDSGDGRQRIDGVALARAWAKTSPVADLLPVANSLAATLDAVGDLLLAEAIHQRASGSSNRARTALSALEVGTALLGDFEIARTQPDAVNTTWRLILPVAENALEAWIASLVGDPAQLSATVHPAGGAAAATLTLAALGVTAKGLLSYVQESPDAPALAAKFVELAGGGSATFSAALQGALVAAYAISLLLRNARPLSDNDLGDVGRTAVTDFEAASQRSAWLHDVGRVRSPVQAVGMLDSVMKVRGSILKLQFASAGPHLMLVTIGEWPDAVASGMLLDGWNEITPGLQAATGVAVHYNAPRSRPPQSVLLLVPPDPAAGWDVFGVQTILSETAGLAKMRMVRPADVHGSFLPALYFAENLHTDTVTTNFVKSGFVVEVKQ